MTQPVQPPHFDVAHHAALQSNGVRTEGWDSNEDVVMFPGNSRYLLLDRLLVRHVNLHSSKRLFLMFLKYAIKIVLNINKTYKFNLLI